MDEPINTLRARAQTTLENDASPEAVALLVTRLNATAVKVHGVSFTKTQASQPGRTIPFQM